MTLPLVFALGADPLATLLRAQLDAEPGMLATRAFPDGETWLRVTTGVAGRDCVIVADLTQPDAKFLPLCFLAGTLRELGATQVGLVAPYLCYMRQDKRFADGEALTSRLFAQLLAPRIDWLVTVDPHLHRYRSLAEIYAVPTRVVHGAPALAAVLRARTNLLLVGPDAESAQWVSALAESCGHPWVVGEKVRSGDRQVAVRLPDLRAHAGRSVVIVDDVVSSGHTILECARTLRACGFADIACACVHGLFAEGSDTLLLQNGVRELLSTNTIAHASNAADVAPWLAPAVRELSAAARPPTV